jgi:hypothetical protein
MIEKLIERKKQMADAVRGGHSDSDGAERISDNELLSRMGIKVQGVKHGD